LNGFFIPPKTQLCCVQKGAKHTHSEAVKKGAKQILLASPHLFIFYFFLTA
jgi:hypothetical protein